MAGWAREPDGDGNGLRSAETPPPTPQLAPRLLALARTLSDTLTGHAPQPSASGREYLLDPSALTPSEIDRLVHLALIALVDRLSGHR